MPADDLVLNVRQIAGYTTTANAPQSGLLLMQTAGLGSAYASISPADLVSTALSTGGDMAINGSLTASRISGASAQFSNAAVGMLGAQKACISILDAALATVNGVAVATVDDLAAFRAASVTSFNMRYGDVFLNINDIMCAGGAPIFSPFFQGWPRAPTPELGANDTRLATTAFVTATLTGGEVFDSPVFTGVPIAPTAPVGTDTTQIATTAYVMAAQFAPLASPAFSGNPSAPTADPGNSTGQIATTAFVMNAVAASVAGVSTFNSRTGNVVLQTADISGAGGAILASPPFTGTPTAPTAAPGTANTQLATTAFVNAAIGAAGYAPLLSPAFSGTPTGPTAAAGTNTPQLATTAFVTAAVLEGGGVTSFNARTGAITLLANDISAAGGAPLNSPALFGTPTAPTAAPSTNTTQIATTAFVVAALSAGGGVLSFNGRAGAVTLTLADVTTVFPAATATPLVNGTGAAGSATAWSRGDHVHPTDTSRAAASALAAYLPLTGGTLSGSLTATAVSATGNLNAGGNLGAASATFSGTVGANGTFTGPAFVANSATGFVINTGNGATKPLWGQTAGVSRWALYLGNGVTETGGQAGANLQISSFTDAGVFLANPMIIARSSGVCTFSAPIVNGSDRSLKRAIEPVTDALAIVGKLQGVFYQSLDSDRRHVGLIAQEVAPVLPEVVFETNPPSDAQGRVRESAAPLLGIAYPNIVAVLIEAIKELAARLPPLETSR